MVQLNQMNLAKCARIYKKFQSLPNDRLIIKRAMLSGETVKTLIEQVRRESKITEALKSHYEQIGVSMHSAIDLHVEEPASYLKSVEESNAILSRLKQSARETSDVLNQVLEAVEDEPAAKQTNSDESRGSETVPADLQKITSFCPEQMEFITGTDPSTSIRAVREMTLSLLDLANRYSHKVTELDARGIDDFQRQIEYLNVHMSEVASKPEPFRAWLNELNAFLDQTEVILSASVGVREKLVREIHRLIADQISPKEAASLSRIYHESGLEALNKASQGATEDLTAHEEVSLKSPPAFKSND
jgi:hypothetical protein